MTVAGKSGWRTCALCGRVYVVLEGQAQEGDVMVDLCHNDIKRPSCYELWTVHGTRPPSEGGFLYDPQGQ